MNTTENYWFSILTGVFICVGILVTKHFEACVIILFHVADTWSRIQLEFRNETLVLVLVFIVLQIILFSVLELLDKT